MINPPPRPLQPDGRVHGVVIACARPDGRFLCIRRSSTVIAPLKVCFPGGGIEIGESQAAAVVREMHEEVGALVAPLRCTWRWEKPDGNLTLWGWTADLLSTDLHADPLEVAEILWLTGAEVATHPDAMPTNRLFVESMRENRPRMDA
jgi:(d)CTP diphosphatase